MASEVKLCESPEFRDLIIAAKEHLKHKYPGITEQLIEKDYYVTEALRIVAAQCPTQVIFKGGTSLSKGWELIERFSEDIDLFLNKKEFHPHLSNKKVDVKLEEIECEVARHPALEVVLSERFRKKGKSRECTLQYRAIYAGIAVIAPCIKLEMGTRSVSWPVEERELSSYVVQFLRAKGKTLHAKDESPFPMKLLHFKCTFVEKLFAIHSKVIQLQLQGKPIKTHARHYYDLYKLAQQSEVQNMLLEVENYQAIKHDCHQISEEHFSKSYSRPNNLSFANSPALFPEGDLRETLQKDYEAQCSKLCYRDPHYGRK